MIYLQVVLVILVVLFSEKKIIFIFLFSRQKKVDADPKNIQPWFQKTRVTGKRKRRERRRWVRVTTVVEEKEGLYCEEERWCIEEEERRSEEEERCEKQEWSRGEEEEAWRWCPRWIFVKPKQVGSKLRERNRISTGPLMRSFPGTINGFSISAH